MRAIAFLLLLLASTAPGEIIFSRRIYQEHGPSYQQIWTWNPATGALKPLTHSARDHYHPVCAGKALTFTSPSPDVSEHVKLWSFSSTTGRERVIGPAPESKPEPDTPARGCAEYARSGPLQACGNEELLVVSRAGKQLGRFQIQVNTCPIDGKGTLGKCQTPIRSLNWSKDGKWLLIGEQGLNDGSGQRQDDYYLVNAATMKLSTVASAETAFWLPGRDQIVYLTPQGLAPLPGVSKNHNVWVQQLMFFDPAKGKPTAITSGLSNNVDPAWCALR